MKKRDIIYVLVILLLMVWVAYYHVGNNKSGNGNPFPKIDTATYVDTIPYYKPVPKDSLIIRYQVVKVPTTKSDTTNESGNDSVFAIIPITQKEYSDSLYHAWVSGYSPNLDSIKVYNKTTTITSTKEVIKYKTKHWGAGLQAGCGYGNGISPYIGVGIQYNIFSW